MAEQVLPGRRIMEPQLQRPVLSRLQPNVEPEHRAVQQHPSVHRGHSLPGVASSPLPGAACASRFPGGSGATAARTQPRVIDFRGMTRHSERTAHIHDRNQSGGSPPSDIRITVAETTNLKVNMMDELIRIYDAIMDNEVSAAFSMIIAVVFILSFLSRISLRWFNRGYILDRSGAGLMTTLGVLGTFVGIFIGLLDFDVSQIDASIPKLLEGLKIAFSTSIVGMGAAIIFKVMQVFIPEPTGIEDETTPENILSVLRSINENIDRSSKMHQTSIDEIRRVISSDTDTSLLTQIQKLRTSMHDGQQELIREFREFAQTMTESNSKALIEALEQVIRDFNTQLNEQFGENFKQLNEAVGALLTWQGNYREHVETLEARIEAAVEALEITRVAIEEISGYTQKIPETLAPLGEFLIGMRAMITDLESHLEAVGALKEQAIETFPVIEGNIQKLTNEFGVAVASAIDRMATSVDEQRSALDELRGGYAGLRNQTIEAQKGFTREIDNALSNMHVNLEKVSEEHSRAIDVSTKELERQINQAWSKTQEAINSLDEQIQRELTRVMELMGQHLASLSEKFVEDYGPLTDKLREVVRMAERKS